MDDYERLVNLNVAEFQRFSDRVGAKAQDAGMTEEVLQELLKCPATAAQRQRSRSAAPSRRITTRWPSITSWRTSMREGVALRFTRRAPSSTS